MPNAAAQLKAFAGASVLASKDVEPTADAIPVPARLPVSEGAQQSTQAAFGNVLLGLAAPHFGTRLIPVGTVYDLFIARGLDALNYGCYSEARFLLVGTPSGLTLGPDGGAHQSINTPLIRMGQPSFTYFEPAFADEVALIMRWAFEYMQQPGGSSVSLRLSTRLITQLERPDDL